MVQAVSSALLYHAGAWVQSQASHIEFLVVLLILVQIAAVAIKCRNVNGVMIYILLLFMKPVQAVKQV
jgi:hypothetical protein